MFTKYLNANANNNDNTRKRPAPPIFESHHYGNSSNINNSMAVMPPPPPRRHPPEPRQTIIQFQPNARIVPLPHPPPPQSQQQHSSSTSQTSFNFHPSPYKSKTSIIRTSAISIHETNHGRERRLQRSIPTRDIQTAMKHGIQRNHPSNDKLIIYEYQGKQHVIVKETSELVTTFVKSISLEKKILSMKDIDDHEKIMDLIHGRRSVVNSYTDSSTVLNHVKSEDDTDQPQQSLWNSHSVIIVDKSGSMRQSDVNGSRTRFGAVWLSLAQDYIENRIRSGISGGNDIISIILMGTKPELIIDKWPTNYILYNKIVDFFHQSEEADHLWQRMQRFKNNRTNEYDHKHPQKRDIQRKLDNLVCPKGHGCYGPSLLLAEKLLEKNDNESSALSLLLLSDGRPSDSSLLKISEQDSLQTLKDVTGRMASRFGRRFTFSTIGMGSLKDFDTLRGLVDSAKDYGGIGSFSVPSLSCAAIGRAISSVATSLTTTQTELIAAKGQQRRVRQCIRENTRLIPLITEVVDSDEFDIFMNDSVMHYE